MCMCVCVCVTCCNTVNVFLMELAQQWQYTSYSPLWLNTNRILNTSSCRGRDRGRGRGRGVGLRGEEGERERGRERGREREKGEEAHGS